MRRFFNRIMICLVPTILSIIVVAWAMNEYRSGRGGIRLGVDLVGGTILVYEVDEAKLPENFKATDLAAALKRRIDPNDLYNITIRPVDGTPPRVEIILPTGGRYQAAAAQTAWQALLEEAAREYPVEGDLDPYKDVHRGRRGAASLAAAIIKARKITEKDEIEKVHGWVDARTGRGGSSRALTGDEVENIKGLIAKQGRLEFKILANAADDRAAIDAARAWINDPKHKDELKRLNDLGEPPPQPQREDGGYTFTATLPGGEEPYTYRWVELGKSELYSLGLNSQALAEAPALTARVKAARERGEAFLPGEWGQEVLATRLGSLRDSLLYTRDIPEASWGLDSRPLEEKDMGKTAEWFILVRDGPNGQEIKGDELTRASEGSSREGGRRAIDFVFSSEGGQLFHELTTKNQPTGTGKSAYHRHLAILFDGQIVSAPSLNSPISTHGQITGDFTQTEVNDMVRILRAGALPATLKRDPVSQNSMGATLGEDTITKGTWSILWAFAAVMAFMVFYYRFAGIVACVALLANLLMTVAFMVVVSAAFTLPGLAGLVLMLGMAVDANVLIYERLREERDRGASLQQALRNGYDKALPTILDTHLSSIFTAIVLYVVGNDQLKGFGISLTVGLVISLFTSLYMTRTMFEVWFAEGWVKNLNFFEGLVKLIHIRYWDFMSIRYYWFTATAILTILGAGLFIYRLDSNPGTGKVTVLNIDFTGGTAITARLSEPRSLAFLREKLDTEPLPDQAIEQLFPASEGAARDSSGAAASAFFTVRTSEKRLEVVAKFVQDRLKGNLKLLTMKYALPANAGARDSVIPLTFADQEGKQDYASPSQIQTLLNDIFTEKRAARSSFTLERPAASMNPEGLFSQLNLRMREPVDRTRLNEVLSEAQRVLADTPQPERLENFDSQLAESTQTRALYAILASWIAILMYLWLRFGSWTFGAAAVVCLVHDLFFTLGCIAICHYLYVLTPGLAAFLGIHDFKIDLPAVAALLTLVGYSVSDTIVVFDRIREVRGKNPALTFQMINDSVNQTLTRTILASTTVFVVVVVLYFFGGEGVKLFAFVMIVGVIVGTYSSIYIARPLLILFGEGRPSPALAARPASPSSGSPEPSTGIKK